MKYPTREDEIAKDAIMAWLTDMYDVDEEGARKFAKMQLAVMELKERGFNWTDI